MQLSQAKMNLQLSLSNEWLIEKCTSMNFQLTNNNEISCACPIWMTLSALKIACQLIPKKKSSEEETEATVLLSRQKSVLPNMKAVALNPYAGMPLFLKTLRA